MATSTLSKAAFLLMVLSERLELHNLAFSTGMFSLELQRPPASTKALEVRPAGGGGRGPGPRGEGGGALEGVKFTNPILTLELP